MRDSRCKIVFSFLFFIGMLLCVGACSTPKHTNVLMFGTNTKFALDVSYEPTTSSPSITVGYKRQEAVWMPLLANIDKEGTPAQCGECKASNNGTPSICNDKCLYKGSSGEDTYSVLASFGAKFSGEGATGGAKAGGGLAQYFATGWAARILAEQGGARLVSVQSADSELYAEAKKKGIEIVKPRITKKDKILLFVAPNNTLDTSKWNSLIDKTELADETKTELKGLKDFNEVNQRLVMDAAMNGSAIEALYNQLNKQP